MTQTFVEQSVLDEIDRVSEKTTPTAALLTIGGAHAVAAVVDEFYRRLQADPVTAPYFTALDLDLLRRHQVLMLVKVLGGPDRYTGRDLRTAHAGLGIDTDVYRRVCLYLLTTMHDAQVPIEILTAVDAALAGVQAQIVTGDGREPR